MTQSPRHDLTSAAILEMTKPSGDLGIVRPLLAGAARGDLAAQREIRVGYERLSYDNTRPLVALAAAAECAVMLSRIAASHGRIHRRADRQAYRIHRETAGVLHRDRRRRWRPEERRVGKEGVRPCRDRWSPEH